MGVRLKDIARDLGVSVVTVSKVLRNHLDISPETRKRVLLRMQEVNYHPNLAARALVTGRTHMIGLIVPGLIHSFFSEIAKGITRVLRKKGYSLIIASSEEDPELERQEIEQLLARRLDALIVASAQTGVESFRYMNEQKTPYVLIDRRFPGFAANFVGIDDQAAGEMATEHLIANGCRLIAHIGGRNLSPAVDRMEGYRQALRRNGLPEHPHYVITSDGHNDDSGSVTGYSAMKKLLGLTPRPDGVFCYNDPNAMGAMNAILDARLRIPEDIAIVGCGNVHYAESLRVPLSSIDQDSEVIGEQAARLALSLVGSKTALPPENLISTPKLIARQSSRRTEQ